VNKDWDWEKRPWYNILKEFNCVEFKTVDSKAATGANKFCILASFCILCHTSTCFGSRTIRRGICSVYAYCHLTIRPASSRTCCHIRDPPPRRSPMALGTQRQFDKFSGWQGSNVPKCHTNRHRHGRSGNQGSRRNFGRMVFRGANSIRWDLTRLRWNIKSVKFKICKRSAGILNKIGVITWEATRKCWAITLLPLQLFTRDWA